MEIITHNDESTHLFIPRIDHTEMLIMVGGGFGHLAQLRLQGDLLTFVFLHLPPYRILLKSLLMKEKKMKSINTVLLKIAAVGSALK